LIRPHVCFLSPVPLITAPFARMVDSFFSVDGQVPPFFIGCRLSLSLRTFVSDLEALFGFCFSFDFPGSSSCASVFQFSPLISTFPLYSLTSLTWQTPVRQPAKSRRYTRFRPGSSLPWMIRSIPLFPSGLDFFTFLRDLRTPDKPLTDVMALCRSLSLLSSPQTRHFL